MSKMKRNAPKNSTKGLLNLQAPLQSRSASRGSLSRLKVAKDYGHLSPRFLLDHFSFLFSDIRRLFDDVMP